MEKWKEIKGYDGLYIISNLGMVKSLKYGKERILKPELCKGYYRVTFSKSNIQKRFLVHRIVCFYFKDKIQGKNFVNHEDGNKLNNNYTNLSWCTSSENEMHSYRKLGKVNPIRKLKNEEAEFIRSTHIIGNNTKKLMKKFNVTRHTILNISNGKYYNS